MHKSTRTSVQNLNSSKNQVSKRPSR